jgi:hypothetical protein
MAGIVCEDAAHGWRVLLSCCFGVASLRRRISLPMLSVLSRSDIPEVRASEVLTVVASRADQEYAEAIVG